MAQLTISQAFDLGVQHHRAGRLVEAEQVYRQILAVAPQHCDALHLLGVIATQAGRYEEAVDLIKQAIGVNSTAAGYYSNLGESFRLCGDLEKAISACRDALRLKPDFVDAHYNLGIALQAEGRFEESIASYRAALEIEPDFAEAHHNLGTALAAQGRWDEAIVSYHTVTGLKPTFADAYSNLGNAFAAQGRLDEALASCCTALDLKSDFAEAHNNLGNILKDQGRLDEAIDAYRTALRLKPDYAETHSNLAFLLHYHPGYDAHAIAEEHRKWNRQHAEPLKQFIRPYCNERDPDRKLRIGYVSPDFQGHPVGRFLLPLFEEHDHQGFEVFCYSEVHTPDSTTEHLRDHTDVWKDIAGMDHEQVCEFIHKDKIDILVDLTMHAANNRLLLFARKPAPVQVCYLAYCSTTGLDTIDYRLTDPFLDPPGSDVDNRYSEKSIRLPQTYWCYRPNISAPEIAPLPALMAGHITFGCLNNFCKVTPPVLATWGCLLRMIPRATLLLHAQEGTHRKWVLEQMAQAGVDAGRIRFVANVPMRQYFELYHQVDICLDPFPFGGGMTTCDALWMGVPVVTLVGQTGVGRGGLSILSNLGLAELSAEIPERYIEIAANLARDLPRLSELRASLRQRMQASPLMDAPRFARGIEAAYRQMWRTWCESR